MSMQVSITSLCDKTGMSRQNYYKAKTVRIRNEVDADLIDTLVRSERALQPRLGGKKLHHLLKPQLEKGGVDIGRDRFFTVLKEKGLLLDPLPKSPRTTNSRHNLPVFTNQFKSLDINRPNQAWVSDITYIRTDENFIYLSLITDAYSRKIVGFHAGDSLETIGCLGSLDKAVNELPPDTFPMHHSDRGSQYCSHLYTEKLCDYGMSISMTEEMHCYENAMAERVNGILKQEYGLGMTFRNKQQAINSIEQAVFLYNNRRPHTALKFRTPNEVHKMKKAA